ncbi:hypothetical protein KC19_6G138300 [Ceratodon purpureus]|uniref:Uncharacterized protein n=1 Tax=Ceratodon purpureus TaxID=3225 RepID=A0A8T0HHF0_CERPU|nr:hypothetical protein KC19_6G138300 [Ceratodon purpureus]
MHLQNTQYNSSLDGTNLNDCSFLMKLRYIPADKKLTLLSSTRQTTGTCKIERVHELLNEKTVAPSTK